MISNFDIYRSVLYVFLRVTEVGDNNLVQLETLDGHQLKTQTPYASVKPLRKSKFNMMSTSML